MMACRGCRCASTYDRWSLTRGSRSRLPAGRVQTAEAHWIIWSGTWRVRRPDHAPYYPPCTLVLPAAYLLDVHAYGLDWAAAYIGGHTVYHTGPKFHLVLERIFRGSRSLNSKEFGGVGTAIFFIIHGKVLLLLFSFCFHGLKKNPAFFPRPLRRPFVQSSITVVGVFVPIHLLPFDDFNFDGCEAVKAMEL